MKVFVHERSRLTLEDTSPRQNYGRKHTCPLCCDPFGMQTTLRIASLDIGNWIR